MLASVKLFHLLIQQTLLVLISEPAMLTGNNQNQTLAFQELTLLSGRQGPHKPAEGVYQALRLMVQGQQERGL